MNSFTKLALTLVAAVAVSASSTSAQTTTINWNFTDLNTTFDNGTPVNFTVSPLTAVNSSLSINATSASSGYAGATGGGNAAVSAVLGTLSLTTSTYYSFSLTPSAGFAINSVSFTLGSRSTSTGPTSLSFFSSADSFTTALATNSSPTDSSWNLYTFTFNSTGAPGTPVEFRLYGSGGTSTASNWRTDDLNLTVGAVPVPEPTVYMLLGVGILLCGQRFLRRKSA